MSNATTVTQKQIFFSCDYDETKKNEKLQEIVKGMQMQIWNLLISSSSHKNKMPKVLHYNTVCFVRYTHPRYMKRLFTNIQKKVKK